MLSFLCQIELHILYDTQKWLKKFSAKSRFFGWFENFKIVFCVQGGVRTIGRQNFFEACISKISKAKG